MGGLFLVVLGKGTCATCVTVRLWRSEDKLWELVLPFYYVGPRNWTQGFRLSGESIYWAILPALDSRFKLVRFYSFGVESLNFSVPYYYPR